MITKDIRLVDDDIDYLHLLSIFLESEGFDVGTALGGINALRAFKHNTFRMMITDFNMPKMNGIELAARVRAQYPDTHIVLVTGKNLPEIMEAAANAGISEIFSKPLQLQRFLAVIRSSLLSGQNCAK